MAMSRVTEEKSLSLVNKCLYRELDLHYSYTYKYIYLSNVQIHYNRVNYMIHMPYLRDKSPAMHRSISYRYVPFLLPHDRGNGVCMLTIACEK